jgi:hypothetical protein
MPFLPGAIPTMDYPEPNFGTTLSQEKIALGKNRV